MSQEIILAVQSAARLNDFLRAQLPKVLQDQDAPGAGDCSQARDAGANKKLSQNRDAGAAGDLVQDQDVPGIVDFIQDQNAPAAKNAVTNSKIRRLLFSGNVWVDAGGANRIASQDQNAFKGQKARRDKNAWQGQNGGGR